MHEGQTKRRRASDEHRQPRRQAPNVAPALGCDERLGILLLSIRAGSDGARSAALERAVRVGFANSSTERRLVLLPGKTPSWPPRAWASRVATEAGATILFETHVGPGAAWVAHDPELGHLGVEIEQVFGTSKEANREPDRVDRVLRECDPGGERTLRLAGVDVGLLCCGENNLLANEQANGNAVYVRHHPERDLFEHVRVVFNGAHTNMGNWGKLDRRFEYLSRDGRLALYVTNNGADRISWASALRVYFDGEIVADGEGVYEEGSAFDIKLLRDDRHDGWRALLIDAGADVVTAATAGR